MSQHQHLWMAILWMLNAAIALFNAMFSINRWMK